MLEVKIKKLHKDAVIPTYAKDGDAGMDLTAVSCEYDDNGNICYGTGLAFEIPVGYVGLIFPRSSISKKDLALSNSVGVIDSGYRGEVSFKFKPMQLFADYTVKDEDDFKATSDFIATPNMGINDNLAFEGYKSGDRIGQIIILPFPQVSFVEVDELSDTERGTGGFGSSSP